MTASVAGPGGPSAEESARILLVDDEQSVQTLLAYPLRKDGYEVVSALDGREALDRFAERRFDLVVLDMMLPKVDGIEVCRRLRSRSQVPIIMLTAKDDESDKVLGLEMGADDYITKPFSVREFRSRVRAALRRSEMLRGRVGGEPIHAGEIEIDFERRAVTAPGGPRPAHLRRVRAARDARPGAGPGDDPRDAAGAGLGRLGVPRPADDRRPHPPPAREARARPAAPGVPAHGPGGGLQIPRR